MTLTKNFDKLHAKHGIFSETFKNEYLRTMDGTISTTQVSDTNAFLKFSSQTVTENWTTSGALFVMPILSNDLEEGANNMTYQFTASTSPQAKVYNEISKETTRTYSSDGTVAYSTRYNTQVGTTIYGVALCYSTYSVSSLQYFTSNHMALLGYIKLENPLVVTEPESRILTYEIKGAAPSINIDD
jgi:hypothetical protein